MSSGTVLTVAFLVSVGDFGQSLHLRCDRTDNVLESTGAVIQNCISRFASASDTAATQGQTSPESFSAEIFDGDPIASVENPFHIDPTPSFHPIAFPVPSEDLDAHSALPAREKQGFHWRRALTESFTFLL